jgi:uncharacterized protein YbcI
MAEQIAAAAAAFQRERTGHGPSAVNVVLNGDTLVVTLDGALTPAEKALARTAEGAAQVQEFHRQLFLTASETLRGEIKRITGVAVRDAAAELAPATGTVVQVFPTGTMVQVFLLAGRLPHDTFTASGS